MNSFVFKKTVCQFFWRLYQVISLDNGLCGLEPTSSQIHLGVTKGDSCMLYTKEKMSDNINSFWSISMGSFSVTMPMPFVLCLQILLPGKLGFIEQNSWLKLE